MFFCFDLYSHQSFIAQWYSQDLKIIYINFLPLRNGITENHKVNNTLEQIWTNSCPIKIGYFKYLLCYR